ncbi:MAG: cytochrome C oxidase subunit IV family protein [Gammaproteobacteria bacterium]|jgi:cytochrome c oxidase subunit 4|nr:cytochrome C oxidase subunit IV family protein [Gammaproteobacteria bacterium]
MSDHDVHETTPLKTYFWIWGWLFVLSVCSYVVDISPIPQMLQWILITFFMFAKAGLIMAVFMHMQLERLSLVTMILVPPGALLFALFVFGFEGFHIENVRETFFLNAFYSRTEGG